MKQVFQQLEELLQKAGIETKGLFLNADTGFTSQEFRSKCILKLKANIAPNTRNAEPTKKYVYLDEELFIRRHVSEQANAWLYSFKALLICSKTKS